MILQPTEKWLSATTAFWLSGLESVVRKSLFGSGRFWNVRATKIKMQNLSRVSATTHTLKKNGLRADMAHPISVMENALVINN